MAIPDFQSCMLPVLVILKDGNEWSMKDVTVAVANHFGLTQEEREQLLSSGQNRVIVNRVAWAKKYLMEAGLVNTVRRGFVKLTDAGREVLAEGHDSINMKFLKRFPTYVAFQERSSGDGSSGETDTEPAKTPDDRIEEAYKEIRDALAVDLLQQVKDMSDKFFERLVVELLVAMGYGGSIEDAGKAVGKTGDGGIDGVIKEDKLGLDVIVLQAKRWTNNPVGRPEIQSFVGSMEAYHANKGVFLTTSTFSQPALEYVGMIQRKIVLVDGSVLANLMIDHGIGVSTYQNYALKRLDSDYFQE